MPIVRRPIHPRRHVAHQRGINQIEIMLLMLSVTVIVIVGIMLKKDRELTTLARDTAHRWMAPSGHAGPDVQAWARLDACVQDTLNGHAMAIAQSTQMPRVIALCEAQAQAPLAEVSVVQAQIMDVLEVHDLAANGTPGFSESKPGRAITASATQAAPTVLTRLGPGVLIGVPGILLLLVGVGLGRWKQRRKASPADETPDADVATWWHAYRQPTEPGSTPPRGDA